MTAAAAIPLSFVGGDVHEEKMPRLTAAERQARHRARLRGETVPEANQHPVAVRIFVGQRFGMLTVLSVVPLSDRPVSKRSDYCVKFPCLCDCGKAVEVVGNSLITGHTNSCGSHPPPRIQASGLNPLTYSSWKSMKARCLNPGSPSYPNYGGRGITICDRWLNSFDNFLADMGPRPSRAYSIERENTNGNYEPGNCVWATKQVQQSNRRDSRYVVINGERITFEEWARRNGVSRQCLNNRLKSGMTLEEAISKPIIKRIRRWGKKPV